MKVIIGADDESPTYEKVLSYLRDRGAQVDVVAQDDWPTVARKVAESVAGGAADMGVVMCWTGTGTSMMANKVPGVRAALCWDPWIAKGARRWNDANVLVMSLKKTSPEEAERILDAWFEVQEPDRDEIENIRKLNEYLP
ncbi:MAG: RpiB/LacA/LacB family sugar-phosphate isomerase [Actinomycetota bacterium]|nr:RpiB/LacA/LacB family sugar-phosphate isomerase [Actinomycetota bacterium]